MRQKMFLIGFQLLLLAAFSVLISLQIKSLKDDELPNDFNRDVLNNYYDSKIKLLPDTVDCLMHVKSIKGVVGHVLFSNQLKSQTRGYSGKIDFLVVLDVDYKLLGVEILHHEETPSYINWIIRDGFLTQFVAKTPNQILKFAPDMISGATLSCQAITQDMQKLSSVLTNETVSNPSKSKMFLLKASLSLLVIVFALLHFFFPKALSKTRIVLLILTIVVLGIWGGYFLSMALFKSWLQYGILLETQAVLFTMLVFSFALPLFTKRSFYCQYVCPFGAAQELVGKLNRKKKSYPKSMRFLLNYFRLILFVVILIVLALGLTLPLSDIEPFSVFQINAASLAVVVLAGLMLLLSYFYNKPWCRLFCPTGMLLSLFRKPIIKKRKRYKKDK
jgi:NosR/NirI family transcriptional regulator, nitrous oxide reductase regulator